MYCLFTYLSWWIAKSLAMEVHVEEMMNDDGGE